MFFPKRTILVFLFLTLLFALAIWLDVHSSLPAQSHSSFSQLHNDGTVFSLDGNQDHSRMLSWVKDTASKLNIPLSGNHEQDEGVVHGSVIMPKMGNETLRAQLGHSTWHLIHVMSSKYPTKPKEDERNAMKSFIYLIGRLYPCGDCASHFQEMISLHPPAPHLGSRDDLSQYFCKLHNKVNLRLGHPIFDCNLVGDRWKCGCADDNKKSEYIPSYASNGKFSGGSSASKEEGNKGVNSVDEEEQKILASLSPIERKMRMEFRSMFPEDYEKAVQQASEVPPRYPAPQPVPTKGKELDGKVNSTISSPEP